MKSMLVTMGAIAALASSASAGFTQTSYSQSMNGTIRDTSQPLGTPYPVWSGAGTTVGETTTWSQLINSANHYSGYSDWGSAEVSFGGSVTSSFAGSTYSFSGGSTLSYTNAQSDWEIASNAGATVWFTLDSQMTLSMAMSWALASETVVDGGDVTGRWLIHQLGSNNAPVDPANPASSELLTADSGNISGAVTLGPGDYLISMAVSQTRLGAIADGSGFNYTASVSFSDAGGGAVPGLGALAPLAAAGLARRRRR